MKYIIFILFFGVCSFDLTSQFRQVGTWRYYINNRNYYEIERIGDDLFVNARRLIFDVSLDPTESSPIERTNGLSDYSISTMAYHDTSQQLIVAYDNTILDIIQFKNGKKIITPNYDIHNKIVVGDKTVLQIKYFRNRAYLCSKMGILVFNYNKNEMESTFILGPNGNMEGVRTLEIIGNKIWAATPSGIKEGLINPAINLQDYRNWTINTTIANDSFFRSSQLGTTSYWMSDYTLIGYDGFSTTSIVAKDTLRRLVNLRKIGGKLYLLYDSLLSNKNVYSSKVMVFDGNTWSIIHEFKDTRLYDIALKDNQFYYTGSGFYKQSTPTSLQSIGLSGYPLDNPFRLQLSKTNRLFVSMGIMFANLDAFLTKDGHFVMDKTYWYQHGIWGDSLIDCTNEISSIERDGGLYRAFVRGGIAFEKENMLTQRFRSNNSKLENIGGTYRISAMEYNPIDSSIWIANNSSNQVLKCLTSSGKWYSFDLSMITNSNEIYKIIIDQAGNKWLLTRGDGLILFNEKDITNNNDNVIKQILEIKSKNCTLSVRRSFCGVVDRDGNLWIGSEKGVGMISNCTYDPEANCIFSVPDQKINNPNDTTVYYECVFLNTAVTALAVDGGNRLWVGTSDGVFYNDEYLDDEFIRLNKLNSPFSVKSISDIIVHPVTGEVFFTTEIGLLSYMGQSVDAVYNEGISPYRIIPNPVNPDYDGLVSIDGLPENAYYKITDVVGNVMYQGKSNGSRVTWDCRSLNGVKVPTGIYYILSSKAQLKGNQGIGKFTVIR